MNSDYTFTSGQYRVRIKSALKEANSTRIYYKYSNEYEFEETNDLTIQGQYDDINKILSLKWSSTNNPNWIKDEVVLFKYDNSSRKWIEYATLPNDGTILIKDAYSINPLTIGPEGSLE